MRTSTSLPHQYLQIIGSPVSGCRRRLRLPLVYNCSGYERVEALRLLEGIVDIYMPDFKYADETIARKLRISDYPRIAREALKEMHRQVGDLALDKRGVAFKGLLIRHLVMPGNAAGPAELMKFIAREISPRSWINIMDQYYPAYMAYRYPEINRRITPGEYTAAIAAARESSREFNLL